MFRGLPTARRVRRAYICTMTERPPLRILLVDDSRETREAIVRLLEEIEGLDFVWVAETVAESRAVLQHLKPDVALVDLRLPDGSGLDVLAAIRRTRPDTLVVLLTALETPYARRQGLDAGADFFLGKSALDVELPPLFRTLREARA
jgi:two-component system, NarL family, response regulator DevR